MKTEQEIRSNLIEKYLVDQQCLLERIGRAEKINSGPILKMLQEQLLECRVTLWALLAAQEAQGK